MISPAGIIGALVGVAVTFGLGVKVGATFEAGRADGKLLKAAQQANALFNTKVNELTQCRAEVSKFNEATESQSRQLATIRANQAEARKVAARDAAEREERSAESREALLTALGGLREKIDEMDFGVCAGEPVPDDFISLLNDATAAASGD